MTETLKKIKEKNAGPLGSSVATGYATVTTLISKKDIEAIRKGHTPKTIRLYRSGELHYEFGDNPWDFVAVVTISEE